MNDDHKKEFSRREFITFVGGSALLLGAARCIPHLDDKWETCPASPPEALPLTASNRVVEVTSENSIVKVNEEETINEAVVADMFRAGLVALTGAATLQEAWTSVLPGRAAGEKIGLKVNTLNQNVPSSPEVVAAVIASLQNDALVPSAEMFVWDRTVRELERARITTKMAALNVECRGTVFSPTDESGPGYETESVCLSGKKIFLSRILTEDVAHLINISVMKNHYAAKFSGCLKNHYGSFSTPYEFHQNSDLHVANLNALPQITQVSRLWIMDALFGVCIGDTDKPADCVPKRLLMSFDPVAIDTRGQELRDEMRAAQGEQPGPAAGYLGRAADLGLGSTTFDLVTVTL